MTLPVSSYEELLVRVRSLTHETIQLRRELSSSLSAPGGDTQGQHGYATHPQRTVDQRRMTSNDEVRVFFLVSFFGDGMGWDVGKRLKKPWSEIS